jgi:hypothetical protein
MTTFCNCPALSPFHNFFLSFFALPEGALCVCRVSFFNFFWSFFALPEGALCVCVGYHLFIYFLSSFAFSVKELRT